MTIVGQGNQLGQSWVCASAIPHRTPTQPSSYPEAPSFRSSVTLSFVYFRNPLYVPSKFKLKKKPYNRICN